MTDSELYRFDLKGWILRPATVPQPLLSALRDQLRDGETPPPAGAAEGLIPLVMDVAQEVVEQSPVLNVMEFRNLEEGVAEGSRAALHGGVDHGGYGLWRHDLYRGKPRVGCLSIIVELDDLLTKDSGTRLVSGSHKRGMDLPWPDHASVPEDLWESYSCVAGTILFWNEHIAHWGPPGPKGGRRHVVMKFTQRQTTIRTQPWPKGIAAELHPKTRKLLRDAYGRTPV